MGKITQEDKILIKTCKFGNWRARKMLNEFPRKQWARSGHILIIFTNNLSFSSVH